MEVGVVIVVFILGIDLILVIVAVRIASRKNRSAKEPQTPKLEIVPDAIDLQTDSVPFSESEVEAADEIALLQSDSFEQEVSKSEQTPEDPSLEHEPLQERPNYVAEAFGLSVSEVSTVIRNSLDDVVVDHPLTLTEADRKKIKTTFVPMKNNYANWEILDTHFHRMTGYFFGSWEIPPFYMDDYPFDHFDIDDGVFDMFFDSYEENFEKTLKNANLGQLDKILRRGDVGGVIETYRENVLIDETSFFSSWKSEVKAHVPNPTHWIIAKIISKKELHNISISFYDAFEDLLKEYARQMATNLKNGLIKWEKNNDWVRTSLGDLMDYDDYIDDEYEDYFIAFQESIEVTHQGIDESYLSDYFFGQLQKMLEYFRVIQIGGMDFGPPPPLGSVGLDEMIQIVCQDLKASINSSNQSPMVDPIDSVALNNRATSYLEIGDLDNAVKDVSLAFEIDPTNSRILGNKARMLGMQGRYRQAIIEFGNAISMDSANYKFFAGRAYVYAKLGDHESAILDHNTSLDLYPDNWKSLMSRGISLGFMHRYDEALEDLSKSLELYPMNATALINRGTLFGEKGNHMKAIEDLRQAVKIDRENFNALSRLALAYIVQDDMEMALENLNKAIGINPSHAKSYAYRGLVYTHLERYTDAMEDLDLSMKLDPNDGAAFYYRGALHERLGNVTESEIDMEKASQLGYVG